MIENVTSSIKQSNPPLYETKSNRSPLGCGLPRPGHQVIYSEHHVYFYFRFTFKILRNFNGIYQLKLKYIYFLVFSIEFSVRHSNFKVVARIKYNTSLSETYFVCSFFSIQQNAFHSRAEWVRKKKAYTNYSPVVVGFDYKRNALKNQFLTFIIDD